MMVMRRQTPMRHRRLMLAMVLLLLLALINLRQQTRTVMMTLVGERNRRVEFNE
jgi:hypothetical protein